MKIIQPRHTKKAVIITSVVTLVLLAGIGLIFYLKVGPFATNRNGSINLDKPTDEQIETGKTAKKQTIDQTHKQTGNIGSDPAPAPQPIEGSDKKSAHAEITAANQTESTLQIRALIQIVTNSGECKLSMVGPHRLTYTATAGVYALASSSTCKGFDIPLDQLSPGIWTINLSYENAEITASTSKEITVK